MFKAGIRRDEFVKELQLTAGKSALKLGIPEKAEEHLKEALALDPEYSEALITLASLYNEREQSPELLDLLTYSQDNQICLRVLAYALRLCGESARISASRPANGLRDAMNSTMHSTKLLNWSVGSSPAAVTAARAPSQGPAPTRSAARRGCLPCCRGGSTAPAR